MCLQRNDVYFRHAGLYTLVFVPAIIWATSGETRRPHHHTATRLNVVTFLPFVPHYPHPNRCHLRHQPDTNPDRSPTLTSTFPTTSAIPSVTTRLTVTDKAPTPWFFVAWSAPTTPRTYIVSSDGTKTAPSTLTSTKHSSQPPPRIRDPDASTAVNLLQRVVHPLLPSGFPDRMGDEQQQQSRGVL